MTRRRRFAAVLAVMFCQQSAVLALRPMSSYRALDLGADPLGLGLVAASFAVVPLVIAIKLGRWMDRYGEGRFVVVGIAAVAAAGFALAYVPNFAWLIAVQVLLGLGQLANVVGLQTILANETGPPGHEHRFGRFTVAASLGQLAGPALAGLAAGRGPAGEVDTAAGFVLGGVMALAGVLVALPLWSVAAARREDAAHDRHGILQLLRLPSMPAALIASTTVLAGTELLIVYLPAYGREVGLPVETVGVLLAVRGGLALVSRLAVGRLAAVYPRRVLLLVSLLVPAAAYVVLPATTPVWILVVLMVVIGFWLGIGTPLTMAWGAELAPAGSRGTVMALRISGNRLGQTGLPLIAGAAASAVGLAAIFWGLAVLLAAAAVSSWRTEPAGERSP